MAKTCSWCGEQIGFLDMAYDWVEIGKKGHWVCGRCCGKIAHAKIGHTTFKEIATDKTDPELFNHYAEQEKSPEEIIQQEKAKKESQQTNPLYEDIHQIAGDLRFIKNYLIFCIVVGIIFGFIWVVSML